MNLRNLSKVGFIMKLYRNLKISLISDSEFDNMHVDDKCMYDVIIDVIDDDKYHFINELNKVVDYHDTVLVRYFGNRYQCISNWLLEESTYKDGLS